MNNAIETSDLFRQLGASVRIAIVTMSICCVIYPLLLLIIGQTLTPKTANGSLVYNYRSEIVGSELIAQSFSNPAYYWPRPSAVDYNASASGGSNLSPANPELRAKTEAQITRFRVSFANPIPADLITASGSGLDPHITLAAAKYQTGRVAASRGISITEVTELLEMHAQRPGGALTSEPLVNVLLVNMALDRLGKRHER